MATSARRLRIPNPDLSLSQKTYLTSDYTSGTTLTVANNAAFAANDYAVVGEQGQEKTEQKDIASLTGSTTITISSALNFSHQKNTPIYRSEYNAIEISANTGSGWTVISDLTTIQWDQDETIYIHQGGSDSTQYRFRYRNVASGNYSEYSPTITGAGYPKNSVGYAIQEIRHITRDPDRHAYSDSEVIRWLSRAKDIIRSRHSEWWFWRKESEGDITTTASTSKYNLDTISTSIDFIKDVRLRVVDGSTDEIYHLQHVSDVEFDELVRDNNDTDDDYAWAYNLMPPDSNSTSGYIRIYPIPKTTGVGRLYIRYYQPDSDYDDVSDTITVPIPQILTDYGLYRAFQVKGDETRARIYRNEFFGPAEGRKDVDEITGIQMLLNMQANKGKALGQPKVIKSYRGRRAVSRLYGDRTISLDDKRERYW